MNKGFSLLELIVVIAIMAVLVGVAIPVYTNYIQDANDAADAREAEVIESVIQTLVIDINSGATDEWVGIAIPTSVNVSNTGIVCSGSEDDYSDFRDALGDLLDASRLDEDAVFTFSIKEGSVTRADS